MAWRFRQAYVGDDDVLDPFHWNRNHQEFASEFNGYLDRDNFRQNCFTTDDFVNNSCNEVWSETQGGQWSPDRTSTLWQKIGSMSSTFRIDTDAMLIAEYSGFHIWIEDTSKYEVYNQYEWACCRYRLLVDGTTISQSGWQAVGRANDCIYLVGALPLSPGPHEVSVEFQAGIIGQGSSPDSIEKIGETDQDPEVRVDNRELIVHVRYR